MKLEELIIRVETSRKGLPKAKKSRETALATKLKNNAKKAAREADGKPNGKLAGKVPKVREPKLKKKKG
jgi:hypothetical protein